MAIHVLTYLPRPLAGEAVASRAARVVGGSGLGFSVVLLALGAGVVLAARGVLVSAAWRR